jgi:hypothetical protein
MEHHSPTLSPVAVSRPHIPAALPTWKDLAVRLEWEAGWAPEAYLTHRRRKDCLACAGNSIPDSQSRWLLAIPPTLSRLIIHS